MDTNVTVYKPIKYTKILVLVVAVGIVLTTVTFAITIATLVNVNKLSNQIEENKETTLATSPTGSTTDGMTTSPTSSTPSTKPNNILSNSIRSSDVMKHLNALQDIANATGGTRAINTAGFNQTLDYITKTLRDNTDFTVIESFFDVTQRYLTNIPLLSSSIDGTVENYTYSNDASIADYFIAQLSASSDSTSFIPLTVIPNVGCFDEDWQAVNSTGTVVLTKRGDCTFLTKIALAIKYNATAILIYNHGTTAADLRPIPIDAGSNNTLPVLFLSHDLGVKLATAVTEANATVDIRISFHVETITFPVGNICADTPTGDITQTIVIGSHSDSVPAGPGINDNGSGSAANLELALVLYRLFETTAYEKYKYRIRFCWWGAEEVGLLGSDYHVAQALTSTTPGERISDYLINLNYDMLGSPNFMFGIYDGRTAPADTPSQARPGSDKITQLFIDWFIEQNLPWDYTDFSGRSDYGPFLAEGVVAGGLFSGADDTKTPAQYDKYMQMLGPLLAGKVNETHDQCYHQACDHIGNIDEFALERMVQAAGYALEYLARQDDLKTWLYPNGTVTRMNMHKQQQRKYQAEKEYFKFADV